MGMYDIINGEQIKFFYVPMISMPDEILGSKSCLSFSGGNLRNFNKDDEVPWKTFSHNYGKDFNIIDLFPYESKEILIHMIRDGKNIGFVKLLDYSGEDVFSFDCYDDHGNKLNVNNINDVYAFRDAKRSFFDSYKLFKKDAFNKYTNYLRSLSKEDRKKDEIKRKLLELEEKYEAEKISNEQIRKPYQEKVNLFYENCVEDSKYELFGSLIDALLEKSSCLSDKNRKFFVTDDRLVYIVAYHEMIDFIKEEEFLEKYFSCMKFDDNDKNEFYSALKSIDDIYEEIKARKYHKCDINEKYLLKDIERGKYKEYYLKYNIVPYEEFDYSLWDKKEEPSD